MDFDKPTYLIHENFSSAYFSRNGDWSDISIEGESKIIVELPLVHPSEDGEKEKSGELDKEDDFGSELDKTTTVDLGVHSIKNTKDDRRQQFKVVKTISHEKFNKDKHINNLQLVKLSGKANITKAVNTVHFPEKFDDVKPGSVCTIAGWGRTDNKKPNTADKLMEARVTIIDRKSCASQWKPVVKITKDMMCTMEKDVVRGFCNGDTGGPLICGGFIKGIISFGPMLCGTPSGADVYTRLTKDYMKWIDKKTKRLL
ncbi:unnamed protein product, partial [Ranitomeya imitator]